MDAGFPLPFLRGEGWDEGQHPHDASHTEAMPRTMKRGRRHHQNLPLIPTFSPHAGRRRRAALW